MTLGSELAGIGTIGEHDPDLARATAGGFEDDVSAIGRPTGTFVASGVASNFADGAAGGVHDVDVVIAAGTAPTEGEELSIGRPGGIDDIAHVWEIEFLRAGAIGIHEIELRNSTTIADEGYGLTGFGIPCGRRAGSMGGEGDASGAIAIGIADEEFGIALHGGREHDFGTVGRPGGGSVGAAEAGKGNEFVGVERVHADLRASNAVGGSETGERDARGVRRPARGEGDAAERGEGVLVGAVVIHEPKFLCAGARTDKGDLR